jgi:hypothetical protein
MDIAEPFASRGVDRPPPPGKAAEPSMSLNSKITIFIILILLLLFLTFSLPVTARASFLCAEPGPARGPWLHDAEAGDGNGSLGMGIDALQI